MADMGQNDPRAGQHLIDSAYRIQIAVVARRLRARLMAAVDHDRLRLVIQ